MAGAEAAQDPKWLTDLAKASGEGTKVAREFIEASNGLVVADRLRVLNALTGGNPEAPDAKGKFVGRAREVRVLLGEVRRKGKEAAIAAFEAVIGEPRAAVPAPAAEAAPAAPAAAAGPRASAAPRAAVAPAAPMAAAASAGPRPAAAPKNSVRPTTSRRSPE